MHGLVCKTYVSGRFAGVLSFPRSLCSRLSSSAELSSFECVLLSFAFNNRSLSGRSNELRLSSCKLQLHFDNELDFMVMHFLAFSNIGL